MENYRLSNLQQLESESIYIFREVFAQFDRPVLLYSAGKDSSVLLRLAQKAFYPEPIPFPLLHIDTGFKFNEMYSFRDRLAKDTNANLIVYRNKDAISKKTNPFSLGTQKCCSLLKTKGLLDGLAAGNYDAAIGGARRDEEKSRAKERVFSFRDRFGQWDPKNQRPEIWNLFNSHINESESIRVFPLSNWTELDIWLYIHKESIPIVPLYLAQPRKMVRRKQQLIPVNDHSTLQKGETAEVIMSRYRSLGCSPCTGAIESSADSVEKIIEEMMLVRKSERSTRVIDHDRQGSMEIKKREGYF